MRIAWSRVVALVGMLWGLAGMARAATVTAPLAHFDCRERMHIDWDPMLLNYQVSFKQGTARLGRVRLLDEAGHEQTVQLSQVKRFKDGSLARARVSFVSGLKKDASFHFKLVSGKPAPAVGMPTADAAGDHLLLDNGIVAIRLLKTGHYTLKKPATWVRTVAEGDALDDRPFPGGKISGPFQGLRLANGQWAGHSFFWDHVNAPGPAVTACSSRITEKGPLFVEGQVRYVFANGGFYQFTARVLANDPALQIDEQSDLKQLDWAKYWNLVMSLGGADTPNWKPDRALWYSDHGSLPGIDADLVARYKELGFDVGATEGSQFGSGAIKFAAAENPLLQLSAWEPWEPLACYFALLDSRSLAAATPATISQTPFLGIVPLHVGNWRNAQWQQLTSVQSYPNGNVTIQWPLMASPHPFTYLQSGEYDPQLPFSYLRRQWALIGGGLAYHDKLYHERRYEGFVNLDDYKDWILSWKADPKVTYPRLVMSPDDVKRLAPKLADIAPLEALKSQLEYNALAEMLYFKDDEKRRKLLLSVVERPNGDSGPVGVARMGLLTGYFSPWFTMFRQTQYAANAFYTEELLSSPLLTHDQRDTLRAEAAAYCYLLTEPDFNPRGSMVHLGNPNMPINRFMALPIEAELIPDHPRAKTWLDLSQKYLAYKLATMVGPGNEWSEHISYFHASAPSLIQAALVMDKSHRLPDALVRDTIRPALYTLAMMAPPDPRFGGRFIPDWGHEGYEQGTHWLPAAQLMRDRDPELAKAFVWAWDRLGRQVVDDHDAGFSPHTVFNSELLSGIAADYCPATLLRGQWLPGFGATMRAHIGNADETYFAMRQGYFISHSDPNQGDFVLYAKGAPLSTLSLFGYGVLTPGPFHNLQDTVGWHNVPHFGQKGESGTTGGVFEGVQAFAPGDSVSYLRSIGDYGPQRWTRQVLFLKGKSAEGPNYFVIRDSAHSLEGKPANLQAKWWSLRTLGTKDQVKTATDEFNYTSKYGARLNVHLLQPATAAMTTTDAANTGFLDRIAALDWKRAGSPELPGGNALRAKITDTHTITSLGPIAAGQDIMVALYPQTATEAAPRYEALADGAARITTSESTDYVFAGRTPVNYHQGDIAFSGIAGAVRIYPNEVHLVVAEGPGLVSYKGVTLRSTGPAQKIVPIDQVAATTAIDAPHPAADIAFALQPGAGAIAAVAPGVTRQTLKAGVAYAFSSPTPIQYAKDGVVFRGRHGGLVINKEAGTVRMVLQDGDTLGYGKEKMWTEDAPAGAGPFDVTFYPDHVGGTSGGVGNFLYIDPPAGFDKLPKLIIDGQASAPGTNGHTVIVAIMPGLHKWELRALEQPAVFRNWQAW